MSALKKKNALISLPTIIILVSALVILLLVFSVNFVSTAQAAIIGVLIGAVLTSATQFPTVEFQLKHQMKTSALEKRLDAHQHAYALWWKLIYSKAENRDDIIQECQGWWENNCLYLSARPREAFWKAYTSAPHHANLLKQHGDPELMKLYLRDMMAAGPVIEGAVNLPPITDTEVKSAE